MDAREAKRERRMGGRKRADNYIDATAEQKADFIRGMEAAANCGGGFLDGRE